MNRDQIKSISRRAFLSKTGQVAVALPFLEALVPRNVARAAEPPGWVPKTGGPRRFILFFHHQGTIMEEWVPTGTETDFSLPPLLAPLEAHKDRLAIVGGLDNAARHAMNNGNGHITSECSILTCTDYFNPNVTDGNELLGGGISIDQDIAERIKAGMPYGSINLIGGKGQDNSTSKLLYSGPGDPVTLQGDPQLVFNNLFADTGGGVNEQQLLAARRGSVLDAVKQQFARFRTRLGVADQIRLDQHLDKIFELEARVTQVQAPLDCGNPTINLPAGFDHDTNEYEPVTSQNQIDLLVLSMACNLTRSGSVVYLNGHAPTFPYLNSGSSLIPSTHDNWHAMVHDWTSNNAETEAYVKPYLMQGYGWYTDQFAYLLDRLAETDDPDPESAGQKLIDTTCVMWVSDFGNGQGHNGYNIPFVLAGNTGGPTGRWFNFMNGGPNENYTRGQFITNNMYVTMLQAFGFADTQFGTSYPDWNSQPDGALPGLLT